MGFSQLRPAEKWNAIIFYFCYSLVPNLDLEIVRWIFDPCEQAQNILIVETQELQDDIKFLS